MKHVRTQRTFFLLAVVTLLVVFQGCSFVPGTEAPDPTLVALQAAVGQTATAALKQENEGNTLTTAYAQATQTSIAVHATKTMQAETHSEEQVAEATVAAPIVAELPQYGLDKSSGQTGWVNNPLTLDIKGYQEFAYGNDHPEVTAADFVLAADITWDTLYGSSGCGYMFRSDGDKNKPNQYMLLATRFANGHVIFTALADGEIANVHDFYPKTEDRNFKWENGTTNRLAVVARGSLIEIYTNGVKIGEVDTTQPPARLPAPPKPQPPLDTSNVPAMDAYDAQIKEYQDIIQQSESSFQTAMKNYMNRPAVFEDGFLSMIAVTESGRTVCTFDNAWLWLIGPGE